MAIYIVVFALIILLAIPLAMKDPTKTKKAVYLGITFVILYILSIFRYGIGSDYFAYIGIFYDIAEADWGSILSLGYEPLFTVLTKLIALVTNDPEIMYAIYAALILVPVAVMIYRHSDNVWLSVTVYYCLTLFYNSLNFIRQSLAVSVLILAFGFMKRKKIVPVLILGLAAVMLHYTAAIFIPAYLISLIKPTKKNLIIYGSVSVGAYAAVMIMTALGANPADLAASIATAVFGRNYSGYIDSMWFRGLGPEYLIMPIALAAIVLISYFCGWKKRPESDMLLQLTLVNTTIWLFITYAFILERFSMFVFIFQVFTIPSICGHFAEEARESEKAARTKSDKKTPGYSKKSSTEKSDNSVLITVWITAGMFIYNCFGMAKNFHYIFPYVCGIPLIEDITDGIDGPEKNTEAAVEEANLYKMLVELKNADCGLIMCSTEDDFSAITPALLRAGEYAGIDLRRLVRQSSPDSYGALFYRAPDGSFRGFTDEAALSEKGYDLIISDDYIMITDKSGGFTAANYGRVSFIFTDKNDSIITSMEFDLSSFSNARTAYTMSLE